MDKAICAYRGLMCKIFSKQKHDVKKRMQEITENWIKDCCVKQREAFFSDSIFWKPDWIQTKQLNCLTG